MGLPRFDNYAANPDDLRRIAVSVRRDVHDISGVVEDLEPLHARAVESASGEISPLMQDAILDPQAYGRGVARSSLWAALQLENFADAIEVYNVESKDPWSIRTLNAKAEASEAAATAGESSGIPGVTKGSEAEHPGAVDSPGPSGSGLDAETLYRHHARLGAALDDAAREVKTALQEGLDPASLREAWRDGNLPIAAAQMWPNLNLMEVPIGGIDPDLPGMSWDEIVERWSDPENPFSEAELEWLKVNYIEELDNLALGWMLEDAVILPPDQVPAGMTPRVGECLDDHQTHVGMGWILGPDGRWYELTMPDTDTSPADDGPSVGPVGDPDWPTLMRGESNVYIGERPDKAGLTFMGFLGSPAKVAGWLAPTQDPSQYLGYDDGGGLVMGDELESSTPRNPQKGAGPGAPALIQPPLNEGPRANASALLDLVVGAARGYGNAEQIDANNTWASNTRFEVDADGNRRAVVQLSQLTTSSIDPTQNRLSEAFAGVDENGELVVSDKTHIDLDDDELEAFVR